MRSLHSIRFQCLGAALACVLATGIHAQTTTHQPQAATTQSEARPAAPAQGAQGSTMSTARLGTVRLTHAVTANGQTLAAGTYQVRLTTETPPPVVGQSVTETRWVEFMRGSTVAGRELATVLTAEEMGVVADLPRRGNAVRVETLKGGDYLRVWVTHRGQHVLIHLPLKH